MVSERPWQDEWLLAVSTLLAQAGLTRPVDEFISFQLDERIREVLIRDEMRLLEPSLYAAPLVSRQDWPIYLREFPWSQTAIAFGAYHLPFGQAREFIRSSAQRIEDRALWNWAVRRFLGRIDRSEDALLPIAGSLPMKSITILIHGTSAAHTAWWRPNGTLANYVNNVVHDVYPFSDYFRWSGRNNDQARRYAARALLKWIAVHLAPDGHLRIIAHSHGGNVALQATQLGLKVQRLILLGTPMRTTTYLVSQRRAPSETSTRLGSRPIHRQLLAHTRRRVCSPRATWTIQ